MKRMENTKIFLILSHEFLRIQTPLRMTGLTLFFLVTLTLLMGPNSWLTYLNSANYTLNSRSFSSTTLQIVPCHLLPGSPRFFKMAVILISLPSLLASSHWEVRLRNP